MRALLSAATVVAVLTGVAAAEPVKLDEAGLGDVAAGVAFGPGPIDINIGVSNEVLAPTSVVNAIAIPTKVVNEFDLTNQIGNAVAINTNAVTAALASNVSGNGAASGIANFNANPPPLP